MKLIKKQKNVRTCASAIILGLVLILILALTVTGCSKDGKSDVSDYNYLQQKILITGLTNEDFSVTVEELTKLESETVKAEASRFNGEKIKVNPTGPTLDTFLAKYGKKQSDFASVRFTADDQYSIAVPKDILNNRKIILAYADGGKPLSKEAQPIHVIIPEERAMYWVLWSAQLARSSSCAC